MTNKNTIRVTDDGINFLKKVKSNRVKLDVDLVQISYPKIIDNIAKYFKGRDLEYQEFLKIK